jgi:hypothetical protein
MTRFWKLDLQALSGTQPGTKLTQRAPADAGTAMYYRSFPVSLFGIELSEPFTSNTAVTYDRYRVETREVME